MSRRRKLAIVVGGAVLIVGIAVYAWGRQQPAAADAHGRAVALFNGMETYSGATALDQAHAVAPADGVRIMVARDGPDGREIVLAVTGYSDRRNNLDVQLGPPNGDGRKYAVTRCYRWTPDRAWDTADEVSCPRHPSVEQSTAPAARPVSPDVENRVAQALHRARTAASVRRLLVGTPAQVRSVGGAVAVAVSGVEGYRNGRPVPDCLLGYRRGDEVAVWRPQTVQVQPGELPCEPATALLPEAQHPPH